MPKERILVVDDEMNIANSLKEILSDEGYDVSITEDGLNALDMIQSENGNSISGRMSGFAKSDERIASFVSALQMEDPFSNVSMDFSRSRTVREMRARGFRISFQINLDQPWKVTRSFVSVGGKE